MKPVIALVGRPNVGKSTLFNRLTRSRDALVADLPGSSLLAGVSSFNGGSFSYRNPGATLTSGATLVAHWDDGVPLIAFKGGVVGLNFYPPSSDARPGFWDATTDGARLMTNAAGGGSSTPSTTSAKPRGGYCAVAGNTHPYTHIPFRPGTFINLTEGQEGLDSYYKGAVPANYLQGLGITCDTPAGYVKTDMKVGYFGAGDPGIYTYYKKAA